MTIKHFQTKSGRFTTALVYHDGKRTRYDFDTSKIILALAIADQSEVLTLCRNYGFLSRLTLLSCDKEWEIDII